MYSIPSEAPCEIFWNCLRQAGLVCQTYSPASTDVWAPPLGPRPRDCLLASFFYPISWDPSPTSHHLKGQTAEAFSKFITSWWDGYKWIDIDKRWIRGWLSPKGRSPWASFMELRIQGLLVEYQQTAKKLSGTSQEILTHTFIYIYIYKYI